MKSFQHYVVDITNGVEYYLWSETFLEPVMVGAWTDTRGPHTTSRLQTFVEFNGDHILAIL